MKKFLVFLMIVLWSIPSSWAQKDSILDAEGNLLYQYERIVEQALENPRKAIVTFYFKNGIEQRAITYRQEKLVSKLEWVKKGKSLVEKEKIVEKIIVNLKPGEEIEWKLLIQYNTKKRKAIVEKAALLLMNEQFEVTKIVFDEVLLPR